MRVTIFPAGPASRDPDLTEPKITIVWNLSLETGHRAIDLQHQELVELINDATIAHQEGRDAVVLNELLPHLSSYVLFHFTTEEALMPSVPVAHATAHRLAHREFTARIAAMKEKAAADQTVSLGPLVEYLQVWLVQHIMKTDRELVKLLPLSRERGR